MSEAAYQIRLEQDLDGLRIERADLDSVSGSTRALSEYLINTFHLFVRHASFGVPPRGKIAFIVASGSKPTALAISTLNNDIVVVYVGLIEKIIDHFAGSFNIETLSRAAEIAPTFLKDVDSNFLKKNSVFVNELQAFSCKMALDFVVFHELGHILACHTRISISNAPFGIIDELLDAPTWGSLNKLQTLEMDADCFAVDNMLKQFLDHPWITRNIDNLCVVFSINSLARRADIKLIVGLCISAFIVCTIFLLFEKLRGEPPTRLSSHPPAKFRFRWSADTLTYTYAFLSPARKNGLVVAVATCMAAQLLFSVREGGAADFRNIFVFTEREEHDYFCDIGLEWGEIRKKLLKFLSQDWIPEDLTAKWLAIKSLGFGETILTRAYRRNLRNYR